MCIQTLNGLARLNNKKKRQLGAFFILYASIRMLHSILVNDHFHLRNFVKLDLL